MPTGRPHGRPSKYTEELVTIYGLYDPTTKDLRYVGKANCITARLKSHLRDCRRRKTPVYAWVRKLQENGLAPEIKALERVNKQNWADAERRWISSEREKGTKLLNLAEGGDQPFCPTEIRAENARKATVARESDPRKKRLAYIKSQMKRTLTYFEKAGFEEYAERQRVRMRALAKAVPHVCGEWASI